jgi:hypothetical protein
MGIVWWVVMIVVPILMERPHQGFPSLLASFQQFFHGHSSVPLLVAGGVDERDGSLLGDLLQQGQHVTFVFQFVAILLACRGDKARSNVRSCLCLFVVGSVAVCIEYIEGAPLRHLAKGEP